MQQTENHKEPNENKDIDLSYENSKQIQEQSNQQKIELYDTTVLKTMNQDNQRQIGSKEQEQPVSQIDQKIMDGLSKFEKRRYSNFLESLSRDTKSHEKQIDSSHKQVEEDQIQEAKQSISDKVIDSAEITWHEEKELQGEVLNDVLKINSPNKQKSSVEAAINSGQKENDQIQLSNQNFHSNLQRVHIEPFNFQNDQIRFVDRLSFDINIDEDLKRISQNQLTNDIHLYKDSYKVQTNQNASEQPYVAPKMEIEQIKPQNAFEQPYVAPKMEIEEIKPQDERQYSYNFSREERQNEKQYNQNFLVTNNQQKDYQGYQLGIVPNENIVQNGQMRISNHFNEQPQQMPQINLDFISKIFTPASAQTKHYNEIEITTFQFQIQTKQEFHQKQQLIHDIWKLNKQTKPNNEQFFNENNPSYHRFIKYPPMEIEKNQYDYSNQNATKLQYRVKNQHNHEYEQQKQHEFRHEHQQQYQQQQKPEHHQQQHKEQQQEHQQQQEQQCMEQRISQSISNNLTQQSNTSQKAQSQLNDKIKIRSSLKLKNNTVSMALGNTEMHRAPDQRQSKRKFSDSFRSVGLSSVGNKISSNRKVKSDQHDPQDHQNLNHSHQPQLFQEKPGIMEMEEPSETLPLNKTPNNNFFSNRSDKSHQSSKSSQSSSYRYNRFVDTMQVPELTSLEIVKDGREPRVERRSSLNSYHSRSASTCKKSYQDLTDIHMHKIDESVYEEPDEKSVKKIIYLQKNKIFPHQQQHQKQQQSQHKSQHQLHKQEQQEKQQIKQKHTPKFNQDKSLQVDFSNTKPQSKEDSIRRKKAMKLQISQQISYRYESEKKDAIEQYQNKSVQVSIDSDSSKKRRIEIGERIRDQDQRINNVESQLMQMKRKMEQKEKRRIQNKRIMDEQQRRLTENRRKRQKAQSRAFGTKQDKQTPEQFRYHKTEVNSESSISRTGSTGTLSVQQEKEIPKSIIIRKSRLQQFAPNLNELETDEHEEEIGDFTFKDFLVKCVENEITKEEPQKKSIKKKRITKKKEKKKIEEITLNSSQENHSNDQTISQLKVKLHKNPKEETANASKSNEKNDQHDEIGKQRKGILKNSRITKEDSVVENKISYKSRKSNNKHQLERNNSLKSNQNQNKVIISTSKSKQQKGQQKSKHVSKRVNGSDFEETTLSSDGGDLKRKLRSRSKK